MSTFAAKVIALDTACLNAFGTTITYQSDPPFGVSFSITGIVESPNVLEETATPSYLALFVRLSVFTISPVKGDQVTIGGKTYTVFEVNADLEGGVRLSLQEA